MDIKNSTCIQTVTLTFDLYPKTGKYKNGLQLPRVAKELNPIKEINGLKDYLSNRLQRIAQMGELLLNLNSDWKVATRKDKVILETTSHDFNQIQKVLQENGFDPEEFGLMVDYTRKWGVL